jgi:hypothetical protein
MYKETLVRYKKAFGNPDKKVWPVKEEESLSFVNLNLVKIFYTKLALRKANKDYMKEVFKYDFS